MKSEATIRVREAQQNLLALTKKINSQVSKYLLTDEDGNLEAVLLSLPEYRSLLAAAELLLNPSVMGTMTAARQELKDNKGLKLEQAITYRAGRKQQTAKTKAKTVGAGD